MTGEREGSGVTLIEILFAIVLTAIFLAMTQHFSATMLGGVRVLELASEAQEAARLGVQLIERDLREAGLDPTGSAGAGVVLAERDAIRIFRDLNGDGDTNDASERVTYRYSPERGALMRGFGNAPEQPMLNDVPLAGLEFRYFDAAGGLIPLRAGGLDAAARARIRRIDIRLAIEIRRPGLGPAGAIRSVQTASAELRNAAAD